MTALLEGRSGGILPSKTAQISPKSQGFPLAALAAITASHPVSFIMERALSPLQTSPFPMTGMSRASFTLAMISQSAFPLYIWTLVLPWTATAEAPPARAARAHSTAFTWSSSKPLRILTVTGREVFSLTAATILSIRAGSFMRADPSWLFTILGTGHPMLMSRRSKVSFSIMAAALAMNSGSWPNS